jgi:exopolysaccharide production protein ExoZ
MTGTVFNIQILRAVAASLVVIYHLLPMVDDNYGTGWGNQIGIFGVDIFFVISGFVMFYTNRNMDRSPMVFMAERILRIVPLYWLATFVIVGFFIIGFHPNGLHELTLPMLIKSMIFVPSELADGRHSLVLLLGWTLMFELYFYVIFASTFWMRSLEKSLIAVTVVFLLGFGASCLIDPLPYLLQFYFSPITLEFSLGALAAIAYIRWQPKGSNSNALWAAGMVVAGVVAAMIISAFVDIPVIGGKRFLSFGFPALLVVAGALLLEKSGWRITRKLPLLLGTASYSLYLFHPVLLQPSVKIFHAVFPAAWLIAPYLAALVAILIALTGSILIHLQLEARILRRGKDLIARVAGLGPSRPIAGKLQSLGN